MTSGDHIEWNDALSPAQRAALERDFGPGPFVVLGWEDGAPEGGQWLSIKRGDGLAWVSHRKAWESPEAEQSGMLKAIPPTFHSSWFQIRTDVH